MNRAERRAWEAEMRAALCRMDLAWARQQIPPGHNPSNETLTLSLHKARYGCSLVPRELRHASGHWLRERGFTGFMGEPLLPEGELP